MDYQKKVDMKEVKEIQKQTTEIAKILKKEGYEAGGDSFRQRRRSCN